MAPNWPRPVDYLPVWQAMQAFTAARTEDTPDEIWLVEHNPVFTLGQAGKPEHLLAPGDIPVIKTDRGGQVTYHGPGQVVVYILADLRRSGRFIKDMVFQIEESVIATLRDYGIPDAARQAGAPGVYGPWHDGPAKIAALGIKVRNGCTYHGAALNVDMDLRPYDRINPCGYAGLRTVSMASCGVRASWDEVATTLAREIGTRCGLQVKCPDHV